MTKPKDDSDQNNKLKKTRTVIHLGVVFLLIFTAYIALEGLQSSINFQDGLGTLSLALLYTAFAVSSLFIAPPIVYILGPKWSLFIALFGHTLYILSNVHQNWYTLLIASAILGICSPVIWITQATYINNLALHECTTTDNKETKNLGHVLSRLNGIFFSIYGWSGPTGNLVAAIVLGRTSSTDQQNCQDNNGTIVDHDYRNSSISISEFTIFNNNRSSCNYNEPNTKTDICGANHCPYMEEHIDVLQKPDPILIYVLMSIFLVFNILGIVLSGFLEKVPPLKKRPLKTNLLSTVKIMKSLDLWLLLPLTFYYGLVISTLNGSFTQSFISCTYGIGKVGYSMMTVGISYSITCLLSGIVTRHIPRQIQLAFSFTVMLSLMAVWSFWSPRPDTYWVVIVMMVLYGCGYSLLRIHSNAILSLLFSASPEAAFAHYKTWECFGFIVSFSYSAKLCFYIKAYCVIVVGLLAAVCYIIVEIRLKLRGKRDNDQSTNDGSMKPMIKMVKSQPDHESKQVV